MKCTDGNNANIVHEHYNLNWYMDLHNIYKMTQSILIHYVHIALSLSMFAQMNVNKIVYKLFSRNTDITNLVFQFEL